MSTIITGCLVSRAAHGNPEAVARLVESTRKALDGPAFQTWPCECEPRCPIPTSAQMMALHEHIRQELIRGIDYQALIEDPNWDPWEQAPSYRVGSGHEETPHAGGASHCALCGWVEDINDPTPEQKFYHGEQFVDPKEAV